MIKLQPHQLTATGLFVAVAGGYLVLAMYFPVAYIWATYEDLFGEWGQTWFFATGCVFSLMVALSKSTHRLFFLALALALFYVVMEEISWGQRLFGIESPEFFKRYNLQRETNLHNILVGPISTVTKDVVEYTLASGLFLYGLVFPLTLRLGWGISVWAQRSGLAAPPLYLWPFFVTASVLELGWFNFNEAEIAELLVGMALCITAMHYWLAQRYDNHVHPPTVWQRKAARTLALAIGGVFLGVSVLSVSTTWAMYSDPAKRARMDARLLNGFEKFAKRYQRYDRWDVTADLLLQVHRIEPTRTSLLRRLAKARQQLGDTDGFDYYTQKALDISLQKYRKNPDKISVNLALARTYRQLGNAAKADEHSKRAHEIALERAEEKPESAHWAYWLAKTYRQLGNYQAALEQYKKAYELKPTSSKYRRAYYGMENAYGE